MGEGGNLNSFSLYKSFYELEWLVHTPWFQSLGYLTASYHNKLLMYVVYGLDLKDWIGFRDINAL